MNRAFASLYLLIVFSIVGLGWGADKLWQVYHSEPEVNRYVESLFLAIELALDNVESAQDELATEKLSAQLQLDLELYDVSEFADTGLGQRILSGDVVTISEDSHTLISYKRIPKLNKIISLNHSPDGSQGNYFYQALLVFFYLSIALIVYFWVWPLSRDLKVLEQQTRTLGKDGVPLPVNIGPRSAIYILAQSFNRMSERIRELVSTHKEMTYAVSHELRTPLARMKFALEMAADIEDRQLQARKLGSVREDVAEMEGLINELLTYAGFEQGVSKLNLQPGDLGALVRELIKNSRSEMVSLKYRVIDRIADQKVHCEWYLMERAIHNILQNAQRYASNQIMVTLEIDQTHYTVAVEDDGPGIPPEDRARVFNSFVRLRMNTNFDKSGFGLGLSIVSRIMEWHNGRASVGESSLGGARFVLHWPQPYSLKNTQGKSNQLKGTEQGSA
ncbi:ATP-binding protein [Teredinibacter turnerae]|uniref:ATP-binding protein n=1 Tax=Teredinibacter turnerae TaxID=2426 RepID=UPI0003821A60|nr:ATP-binding protein [Teredinibacter turnerae]